MLIGELERVRAARREDGWLLPAGEAWNILRGAISR